MLKTSAEWYEVFKVKVGLKLHDWKGWPAKDRYWFFFNELITSDEFEIRVSKSSNKQIVKCS